MLVASYCTVYTTGFVFVGWTGGFTMTFTDADSVLTYLPAVGVSGPLNGSVLDPISTASGAFGGTVLALRLNVDFDDAGVLLGSAAVRFGDLSLCGFTSLPALNGMTVRQFLAAVNILLGGGSAAFTISDVVGLDLYLTAAVSDGSATTFAQDHLVNGSCP